ncbi:MAG: GNAT family N-acetyltransferase [Candidatus Pacebacteria bacterium]|nr:GNAT family N-acetyltransferase [Candidatus Paceibacterota bacterium]
MKINIDKPKISELGVLLDLWRGQYDYHHGLDAEYYVANSLVLDKKFRVYLEKAINKNDPFILAAYEGGKLVGFITFEISKADYFDTKIKRYGEVIELFVDKAYRGKGIGKKLMRATEDFFKSKSISYIKLQCSTFNKKAIGFYQHLSYINRQVFMFKRIVSEMTSEYVVDLYMDLEGQGVKIWLDGGWGVDALLGKQTRPHEDVDIVIQKKNLGKLRKFLEERGYHDVERPDTKPHNFVLGDDEGHLFDIHVIVIDSKGDGIYGPPEKGEKYPADSLTGKGTISGQAVRCISAKRMVEFHTGYDPRETDYKDVAALCKKFGIKLPKVYVHFKKKQEKR